MLLFYSQYWRVPVQFLQKLSSGQHQLHNSHSGLVCLAGVLSELLYGGDDLKVVRQLTAAISREGHTCTATVLVQKDAPLKLLLGTDLQTQLGFLFLQKTNGTAVDLLQKRKWALTQADHEPEEEPVSPSCSKDYKTEEDNPLDAIDIDVEESPVVRLIQAARLLSRHVKLVRARVLDPKARGARLFESEKEVLKEKGLVIEDAIVEPDENRYVTLAIHNCSLHTVRLDGDHILGCLQEATVLPTPSLLRMSGTVQ